jgi:hypothetical protein
MFMGNDSSKSAPKRVDWNAAKLCLAELQREAPTLLQQAVVIGGIACWFYRNLLSCAKDPDFGVPNFSTGEENLWLSKDIDFTNYFAEDARNILRRHLVADESGRLSLRIAGVPIGFAQVGLTFDPETAWSESWITTFEVDRARVQCRILNPVALYREKLALAQRRASGSDKIHGSLVAEFLRYEVCRRAGLLDTAKSLEERSYSVKFLISVRDRALEICKDKRVITRLNGIIAGSKSITPSEQKLLAELSAFN